MLRCVLGAALALSVAVPAAAQLRKFPIDALRGELQITQPPEMLLNGRPVRLSPAARIRGEDNLIRMPASLAGQKALVHYTTDLEGQLREVWLLTEAERQVKPWPTTAQEAQRWALDPATQTWTRR